MMMIINISPSSRPLLEYISYGDNSKEKRMYKKIIKILPFPFSSDTYIRMLQHPLLRQAFVGDCLQVNQKGNTIIA